MFNVTVKCSGLPGPGKGIGSGPSRADLAIATNPRCPRSLCETDSTALLQRYKRGPMIASLPNHRQYPPGLGLLTPIVHLLYGHCDGRLPITTPMEPHVCR